MWGRDFYMKYCSCCETGLPDETVFCPRCGQKVTDDPKNLIKCTRCGAKLSEGMMFCSKCGQKNVKEPDPSKYCSKCGAVLTDGMMFCARCGQRPAPLPQTEAINVPSSGQVPLSAKNTAPQDDSNDMRMDEMRLNSILSKYRPRKMLAPTIFCICVIFALEIVLNYVIKNFTDAFFTRFYFMLMVPVLTIFLAASPNSYKSKIKNDMRKNGYSDSKIQAVLDEHPFWFRNRHFSHTKSSVGFNALYLIISIVGWLVTVFGLFAILAPVGVMILSNVNNANWDLAFSGSLIASAGIILIMVGGIFKMAAITSEMPKIS